MQSERDIQNVFQKSAKYRRVPRTKIRRFYKMHDIITKLL